MSGKWREEGGDEILSKRQVEKTESVKGVFLGGVWIKSLLTPPRQKIEGFLTCASIRTLFLAARREEKMTIPSIGSTSPSFISNSRLGITLRQQTKRSKKRKIEKHSSKFYIKVFYLGIKSVIFPLWLVFLK